MLISYVLNLLESTNLFDPRKHTHKNNRIFYQSLVILKLWMKY